MALQRIAEKHVLLCEGMHDVQFFSNLIRERDLPRFTISSCGYAAASSDDGISLLPSALDELPSIPGFEHVEAILIVADNDSDYVGAFKNVVNLINATAEILGPPKRRYGIPADPQVRAGTNPVVVVLMIPWTNEKGSLDTLCLTAASNKRQAIAKCVEEFAKCTKTEGNWPITKLGKMKLRSLISAAYMENPYEPPAYVWSDQTDLVPLSDPIFNRIEGFLRGFPALVS